MTLVWFDLDFRMTKYGTVIQVVERHISRGSATSAFQGCGPSVDKIFGTSYMRAHCMGNNNQILHGDQTGCEESFTRLSTNADARAICLR